VPRIIVIIGSKSISASGNVIGDLPSPRATYHQLIIIGGKPGRRGKEKVDILVGSVISMCPSGFFKVCGGRDVSSKKKETRAGLGRVGQDRNASGREFHMDGAEKDKERRPFSDRISGTVSQKFVKGS